MKKVMVILNIDSHDVVTKTRLVRVIKKISCLFLGGTKFENMALKKFEKLFYNMQKAFCLTFL